MPHCHSVTKQHYSDSKLAMTKKPIKKLKDIYMCDVSSGEYSEDAQQLAALEKLDDLLLRLVESEEPQTLVGRISSMFGANNAPIQGLYFWGGVGRGKTYLMDMFLNIFQYHLLP